MLKYLLLACLVAVSYAAVTEVCQTQDQCGEGECCQILSEYFVVSKKRIATVSLLEPEKLGTCQKYKLENDTCGIYDKINGYCSCAPGLICYAHQVKIVSARTIIAPEPGYRWSYECKPSGTV